MYKEITIRLTPAEASNENIVRESAAKFAEIDIRRIIALDLIKRSVDARQREVKLNLTIGLHIDCIETKETCFTPQYQDVSQREKVIVVGAGPAGLFAALRLIELGYCPIVLERGKSVEDRKTDLATLYRTGIPNENSNFGFGEGGAGTFSDGKLYTRSKKRGNTQRILEIFVHHGATEQILIDSHPHLGTDKLPQIIVNIRKNIEKWHGEVLFNAHVNDILLHQGKVVGVVANGIEYKGVGVILATGHSSRDVYRMLYQKGISLEAKDFAVGLRIEHPQHLIDCIQYHNPAGRGEFLPAAEYNFVADIQGRGVYTFCMCPGGVIVPAATGKEQQVVNGMSASKRNTKWANSAVVTSIGEQELKSMNYTGLFAGIDFQEALERKAWEEGGCKLFAPAQRLTDFLKKRESSSLPVSSYKPGVTSSSICNWFPNILTQRLQAGLEQFGRKAHGYITPDAVLLGVETRTSSPIRIPRTESCRHIEIEGLYPCGEGAGYAGGIVSAAMDGEKCAEELANSLR